MSEDCFLSFFVHGCPLAAECSDAKIWEEAFNIYTTRKPQLPLQSCSHWSSILHILLTQSGMYGSWSSWSSGRIGSWWMERPKTGGSLCGTTCWQRNCFAVVCRWSWRFSVLQEPQVHVTRMGSCCFGPGIGQITLVWHRIPMGKYQLCEIAGLHLPWWRISQEPGLVQERLFGRKASTPLPGMSCGFAGSSSTLWPSCWWWDVQPWKIMDKM